MAYLKTICIDNNCMDNHHEVFRESGSFNYELQSNTSVSLKLPRTYEHGGHAIIMIEVRYPANANGVRYMNQIADLGETGESIRPGQRVGAASSGETILSSTRLQRLYHNEDVGVRLYQNSGQTLNLTIWWDIRVIPTLGGVVRTLKNLVNSICYRPMYFGKAVA